MCADTPGSLGEPWESVTQAQGWSQPCTMLVLRSVACGAHMWCPPSWAVEKLAELVRVGPGKGQAGTVAF